MSDSDTQILADSLSAESVNAAAVHAESVEKSRAAQISAAIKENQDGLVDVFTHAMRAVLTEGDEGTKALLIKKIPLLCTDIMTMKSTLSWILKILIASLSLVTIVVLPLLTWILLQIVQNDSSIAVLNHSLK